MPKRMTRQTLLLLEVLAGALGKEWYGLELMEISGLKSGTVYPIVHRLQEDGWLCSTLEDIDPHTEGRPARRLYRLTGLGEREASSALADRRADGIRVDRLPELLPKGATI